MNLTRREIKGRYSQSLFGAGWAIAQPLATMAVFTLVFARLGQIPSGGAPYPLFAYAALVPWFFFSNSVNSGTMSLITYRNIVTKTYFPREIVPLAQVSSRLVDFTAAATLYAVLMIYYGVAPGVWGLMVPVFFVAARAVHAGRDVCDLCGQRLLPRRQSRRADRSSALALSDAGRLPVVRGPRALSPVLSPQPADRHRRRHALGHCLRPPARVGGRRRVGGADGDSSSSRHWCCSSAPTSISRTSSKVPKFRGSGVPWFRFPDP